MKKKKAPAEKTRSTVFVFRELKGQRGVGGGMEGSRVMTCFSILTKNENGGEILQFGQILMKSMLTYFY